MGALSSTLDSAPVVQKNSQAWDTPNRMPSTVRVPWLQLFKISSTGAIVTKIAANRTATSTIGPNVNALRSRCSLDAAP